MRNKFYFFWLVALLLPFSKSFSQTSYTDIYGNTLTERPNTPISEMINGYIEVLPQDYDPSNATQVYPLIIFLEGQNQFGNGNPTELQNLYSSVPTVPMFPNIVRNNDFPNSYVVNSTTYHFIVLIPQFRKQVQTGRPSSQQMASPEEVNDIINYALQNYRVDVNRIYLMGLSLGGGSTWNYAGDSVGYANRLAAIVPFAGASDLNDNHLRVTNIAQANLPVWTFVANGDPIYVTLGSDYIDSIHTHPEHTTDALITIYSGAHESTWIEPLVNNNTGPSMPPNLYEWLLGYALGSDGRIALSQPTFATVDAGFDQTKTLDNGSMVLGTNDISFTGAAVPLQGTVTAATGRNIDSTEWVRVDGNGGTITDPSSPSTTVTDLKPGSYTFQLRATDDQGLVSVDAVHITIQKPVENTYQKIEAEDYTTLSGPLVDYTFIDEGPTYGIGYFDPGKSVSYTLSTIPPGTYALYYRYTSPGNMPLNVIADGITYPANLVTSGTWRSDSVHVELGSTPTIEFVSQGSGWNLDYFELALLSPASVLPVKFISFNSRCSGAEVSLQWKTAQEQNSSNFLVQKSTNGLTWTDIGTVAAAGQSGEERSYEYMDKSGSASANLYRIVEYDLDGKRTISSIVRSNCYSTGASPNAYPNPSSGPSIISVTLQQRARVAIEVLDSRGVSVLRKTLLLQPGTNSIPIEMGRFADGVYSITVQHNDEKHAIKFIKK